MSRRVLSLAGVCLLFPTLSQAGEQPRQSENGSGRLPFRLSSGYLIEVEGRIEGETHLKFILATGATISIVSQRISLKTKLDAYKAQSFNFDRNLKWNTATV